MVNRTRSLAQVWALVSVQVSVVNTRQRADSLTLLHSSRHVRGNAGTHCRLEDRKTVRAQALVWTSVLRLAQMWASVLHAALVWMWDKESVDSLGPMPAP